MTHPAPPAWRLFWAKTDRDNKDTPDPEWTRPLWAHLLDVAHTALLLWERAVPTPLRREAAAALGLPKQETEAGHLLSLWIGYHDLGKSIPSFQFEHGPTRKKLKAAGLRFEKRERLHHGHATIALLHRLQREGGAGQSERRFWTHLGAFVGFHHGWLCSHSTWERHARGTDVLGGAAWAEAQAALHREVTAAWRARYPFPTPAGPFDAAPPDWLLGLAGWATFADWLGSNAPCFTRKVKAGDDLDAYVDKSREGAEKALRLVGLDRPAPGLVAKPFGELFKSEDGQEKYKPNALQRLVLEDDFPAVSDAPTLTIIEAPTGEGKTEAALALVARQQAHERGGFYLALPTQATSNGLFGRAVRFLERAHAEGDADFRLAYGNAQLHEGQDALWEDPTTLGGLSSDDGDETPRDDTPRVRTLRWFLSPKRALLAPYGLGTVDQAMIGALRTRHFFLRLYGLAGKTVVIDEVHAYDLYMREIIGRLLGWLRALGCHVVLLSATLPARLRDDLVEAWDPSATPPAPLPTSIDTPYPAVWTVADGVLSLHDREGGVAIRAEQGQAATLRRHDETPEAIARTVAEAVRAGAVVGVILNTVARAQDVFEAIGKKVDLGPDDLVLFHARFLLRDRQKTERDVVGYRNEKTKKWVAGRFGKGRRGGPAVLVATQVAEQSLDLDVDLLLTDLAPIDLMLQRAGRLHRHTRDDRGAYAEPQVVWLCPDAPPDGLPEVKSKDVPFGFVYDPVVLWRTWRLLRRREGADVGRWSLPGDYRELIETVYPFGETVASKPPPPDGLSDEAQARWQSAVKGGRQDMLGAVARAGDQCIPAPGDLFSLVTRERSVLNDEDDGDAHETLRATTREGESVEVVVLHRDEGGALFLDAAHETPAPLALPTSGKGLGREAVRAVLGASVRLSQTGLVHALRERPESEAPPEWRATAKATPAIRHHHAVVLTGGVGKVSDWHVQSDARLGILVTKQS